MSCEAEKVHTSFDLQQENPCGVRNRDGIFYALLKFRGQDAPLEVALHGVRSENEAQLALASLNFQREADCMFALS